MIVTIKHCIECWDSGSDGGFCMIDTCPCHERKVLESLYDKEAYIRRANWDRFAGKIALITDVEVVNPKATENVLRAVCDYLENIAQEIESRVTKPYGASYFPEGENSAYEKSAEIVRDHKFQ